jgi:hypothetical protein
VTWASRWLPTRLHGERDLPMWTALGLALLLTIQPTQTGGTRLVTMAILIAAILAARVWRLGWLGVLGILALGIAMRLGVGANEHFASDVLDVTGYAMRRAFQGENPWGHGFAISRPPGAPLPYGPVEIFWYTPAIDNPRMLELFVSCAVLAILAVHGRPVGLAVYALAPTVILTGIDGSNDTSAGLLILTALALAAKRPWAGAIALGVACAFKPYAAAWLPGLLVFGGLPALLAFLGSSLVVWAPSLLSWGPGNYLLSLQMAEDTHHGTYWSLGVVWEGVTGRSAPKEFLDRLRLFLGALAALGGLFVSKTIDGVILSGILVFILVMFGGYWGSYAYIGALAPIICWRLDDWLGIPDPRLPVPFSSPAPTSDD